MYGFSGSRQTRYASNSILLHLVEHMPENNAHSDMRILAANLPGFQLPDGGSVPPESLVTNKKLDKVMIDETSGDVELFYGCSGSRLIRYAPYSILLHLVEHMPENNAHSDKRGVNWRRICRAFNFPTEGLFRRKFSSPIKSRTLL